MIDEFQSKEIHKDLLVCKPDGAPVDNPFYNKKVVLTGDLEGWDRPAAAAILQLLGADVNTSISSKTNIVIVGQGVGPKKLEKIIDLLDDGFIVRLLNERLFNKLILPYKDFLHIS
jgi:DNA polymerase-3 subunit epsilon